ncbi:MULTISPECIES: RNA polymerase sigma factor [Pseudofrankia]|uniref:RNA polymerase sigma factor n=1 Tax=Pseudofrankia TaxID=2994363 RepID=UPI000234DBD9|nr:MULTISPECIES: sigma-70 family RNA polymerase sigma factor [Pseudofrankia]OHV35160.1 hypothetical protein BCD49_04020 [Pseudofrankia sp. EUN1h]
MVTAFSAFYRAELPRLWAFLRSLRVPAADVEDISQRAMTTLLDRWERVDNPRAYVRTVAAHDAHGWRRTSQVELPVGDLPEPTPLSPRPGEIDAVMGQRYLLGLVTGLPPRQRQVVAWWLDGFTPTEIAAELGITPEAVRTALAKARRSLKSQLADEGDGPR